MYSAQRMQFLDAATELRQLLKSGIYNNPPVVKFLDKLFGLSPPEYSDEEVVLLKYHLLDALSYLSGRLRVDDSPVVYRYQEDLLQALLNFDDMQAVVARHYPVLYEPDEDDSEEHASDSWRRLLRLLSASLQISG